jgi:phosphonate degradation associated HDIG domain protein
LCVNIPMMSLSKLGQIEELYASRGALNYGEGITQLEHALQCATLAQAQNAPASLVAAALLHDIGHLFEEESFAAQRDDRHQIVGSQAIEGLFGEAVCKPIALHVAAKRYLCFKEANYFKALSPASKVSLMLQGGPLDTAQATAFEQLDYWQDAVALRRFDDMGKRDDLSGRAFAYFAPILRGLLFEREKS